MDRRSYSKSGPSCGAHPLTPGTWRHDAQLIQAKPYEPAEVGPVSHHHNGSIRVSPRPSPFRLKSDRPGGTPNPRVGDVSSKWIVFVLPTSESCGPSRCIARSMCG